MRLLATAVLVLAATTACTSSGSVACTAAGAPPGIEVDVDEALSAKVRSGTLEHCWDGTCRTGDLGVLPSTFLTTIPCTGAGCTPAVRETGGKQGFLDLPDLPEAEVRVTLRLVDPSGATVVDESLTVTPVPTYPNGRGCEADGPQARLVVDATGVVRSAAPRHG